MRLPLHLGVLVGIVAVEIISHRASATIPPVLTETGSSFQSESSSRVTNIEPEIPQEITNYQELDGVTEKIVPNISTENSALLPSDAPAEEVQEKIPDNKKPDAGIEEIVPQIAAENSALTTPTSDEITQKIPPVIPPIQVEPNQDHFLQRPPIPIPSPDESPILPKPIPQPNSENNNVPIQVQRIEITGSTILTSEQIESLTKPLEGRTVAFEDLTKVVNDINKIYVKQGYTTSRAVLEQQTISNGIVRIQVIEGTIEDIEVKGNHRLNANYITSRVKLGIGTPLNTVKLEEQLRLLRGDPIFERVEAKMRAGSSPGQTILVVKVVEADPLDVTLSIDNYSPPSIGSERLGINARYLDVTGIGDVFTASYHHTTTSGSDQFDFTYQVPLNAKNGTLQLRAAPSRYRVTQEPFDVLDIHGDNQLYEISFRQPIVRTLKQELALSLGFAYESGQTFTFAGPTPFSLGPDNRGVSRTSVVKFGQDYTRWDKGGAWALRSQFSFGTGLFDATKNPEPIPDGRFFSWLGQIQRLQRLGTNNILIMEAEAQLTPDSLLPSQQFIIGGGESVRGYRQNVRAGDNGVRFSIEDRITIKQNDLDAGAFQLAPFGDLGVVWNSGNNPNEQPDQTFIAGVGLGLIWQALPKLNIRLDYGLALVDLDDRGNNAQDDGFYFSVKYQF